MRASDVIIRVRNTFGDKDAAQVQDEDFLRWINDAQRDIATKFEYSQIKASHDLVAMEDEYTLPQEAVKIYSVIVKGIPLTWIPPQEGMNLNTDTSPLLGTPTQYWVWGRVINLYPTPDSGKVGGLVVYYVAQPDEVIAVDSGLTVPPEYHRMVMDYCLAQAYLLDNDLDSYNTMMAKIAADFPVFYNDRTSDSTNQYPHIGGSGGDWDE